MSLKNQPKHTRFFHLDGDFIILESKINFDALPEPITKTAETVQKKITFVESKELPAKIKSYFPPKDFDQKDFCARVYEEMAFIGLTLDELAPMVYTERDRLGRILRCVFKISEQEHKELCRIFGMD